jgi:hypothetical protein
MTTETDMQQLSELADARLSVAEDLGWPLAALAATSVYLEWESWLVALGVAVVSYVLATMKYRRDAAKAEDEYFRIVGRGKYAGQGAANDV